MENILYGDGVRDDYPAIQELLDSGVSEIYLPVPKKHYLISKTLKIHGGQTFRLGATTRIKLAAAANCAMIENADFATWSSDIVVDGGIWDMNHNEQDPNPWHFKGADGKNSFERLGCTRDTFVNFVKTMTVFPDVYTGFCMRFCRIKRFTIKNITIHNPVTYGAQLAYVEYFTVENVRFDYTEGSPKLWNMDGIHLEGGCKHGLVRNLQGACHDDLVAVTADDGLCGPISDIVIDGIHAEGCLGAVRILSHGLPVENVRISNIYGSYYSRAVCITKYHGAEEDRGVIRNVTITDVVATVCEGTADVRPAYPRLFWIQKGVDVENLHMERIRREERYSTAPLLYVEEGATVNRLRMKHITQKNHTDQKVEFLRIDGVVTDFESEDVQEV